MGKSEKREFFSAAWWKKLPGNLWHLLLRSPLASLIAAIIFGGIIIEILGYSAFTTYGALVTGAFSDFGKVIITLAQMTPVMFTGLAYAIVSRAGLTNLGMEGQLLGGAMAAAIVGLYVPEAIVFLGPIPALLAAAVVGGLIALIPALLKRWLGSNEMLISLMLNYVVELFTIYLVNYVVATPDNITPATSPVLPSSKLTTLIPGSQLSSGFLIAIVIAVIMWFFLYKTGPGYMLRATGVNLSASNFKGINVKQYSVWAFVVGGMIAGLGGAVQVLGVHGNFIQGMSPGYGWDGMSAALLGGCEPIGVIFGSLVFGAMRSGGIYLSRTTDIPSDFIYVIEGILMMFIATPMLLRRLQRKNRASQEVGNGSH